MTNATTGASATRAAALLTALHESQTDVQTLLAGLQTADLTLPTVCEGWSVADEIGHIIDATEMLVRALEQGQGQATGNFRPQAMAAEMSKQAVRRATLLPSPTAQLAAFNQVSARLLELLDRRDPQSWDEPIAHPYLGQCPAVMIAGFALLDWFIHPWDIRQALGQQPQPRPDHAALLVTGLVGLLPRRLNLEKSADLQGRFRYVVPNQFSVDAVLADNQVTIERNVEPGVPADLTFAGQPTDLVLAMLGRRSAAGILQPAPTNPAWLPRWGSLWISL